jgi:hypothetical protein
LSECGVAYFEVAGRAGIKDNFELHSERVIVAGMPEVLAFFAGAAFRPHSRGTRDGFGSKNHSHYLDGPLHITRFALDVVFRAEHLFSLQWAAHLQRKDRKRAQGLSDQRSEANAIPKVKKCQGMPKFASSFTLI